MGRYIKKFSRIGSIGPSEERGFGLWVGYDVPGVEDDLSADGYLRVDGWSDEELATKYGVTSFAPLDPERIRRSS